MNVDKLINEVDFEFKKTFKLPQKQAEQKKKMLVAFSGVPGSGKSTLAKVVANSLNCILINKDDIRNIVQRISSEVSGEASHQIANEYIFKLVKELSNQGFNNFVFDGSVDKKYSIYHEWCKENYFDFYVIQMEIPKEEIISRLKLREAKDLDYYLSNLDKWFEDQSLFKMNHKTDFTFTSEKDVTELIDSLQFRMNHY